jgi:hypothetical protein
MTICIRLLVQVILPLGIGHLRRAPITFAVGAVGICGS